MGRSNHNQEACWLEQLVQQDVDVQQQQLWRLLPPLLLLDAQMATSALTSQIPMGPPRAPQGSQGHNGSKRITVGSQRVTMDNRRDPTVIRCDPL